MTFTTAGSALHDDLVALRRRLHTSPETGLDLPQTQQILLAELSQLGLELSLGQSLTSITAVLRGGRPGPVVLLRADMDALPVVEASGLPYAADNGAMHACGHDLHMAGLVGAARLLAARREELPGSVIFMFQPGEEGFGGARLMLQEGVLEAAGQRPVAAYALHVDCVLERGVFATREQSIMASANGMRLVVRGSGGHAAFPHLGVDPVPVASQIVLAIQSFVARRVPATDPAVISVTQIVTDSSAPNVLSSSVELVANIRTLSRSTLALVRSELAQLAQGIATAHGCEFESEFIESYPVTHNDPAETTHLTSVLEDLHGPERLLRLPAPSMASEDFAYVLDEVPGTLVFLGARPPHVAQEGAPTMHSAHAQFDDSVLERQAVALAEIAWRRLQVRDPALL
ncbi:M20 metallopeptidase family protein [Kineosporia babensis]|uniref:M20 family metallopeptidase n=1 Tax=Kineosporia babensis TaxID=499548 RepID=A0A9X1SX58_9ACTN|nr:M20 family metallopeptidase [Kineosporia babensis]MCD5314815.1 M20 family metallopeptidase [Kineosporia babensis]